MVEIFVVEPAPFQAGVDEAKGQIVRPADVAQVVEVLVRAADCEKIGSAGRHAGAVVGLVEHVAALLSSPRVVLPVQLRHGLAKLLEGRKVEGVEPAA